VGVVVGTTGVGVCDDSATAELVAVAVGAGGLRLSRTLQPDSVSIAAIAIDVPEITVRVERFEFMRSV
jgi:CBS-domain-containing membrane protein